MRNTLTALLTAITIAGCATPDYSTFSDSALLDARNHELRRGDNADYQIRHPNQPPPPRSNQEAAGQGLSQAMSGIGAGLASRMAEKRIEKIDTEIDKRVTQHEQEKQSAADAFDAAMAILQKDKPTEDRPVIHSKIVGDFNGWRGNTQFTLTNGQTWIQLDKAELSAYKFRPEVTIIPTPNGDYLLTVENIEQSIPVMLKSFDRTKN